MNEIEKFLRKLTKKEQEAFSLLINQLNKDFSKIPGIKKLQGKKSCYRIRVGRYRLIFIAENNKVEIVRITKRDERTYENL